LRPGSTRSADYGRLSRLAAVDLAGPAAETIGEGRGAMDNWITGFLALAVMGAFLLALAISIGAIPFYIIILIVLGFTAADFIQASRSSTNGKNG
jgi:hypothetical protein